MNLTGKVALVTGAGRGIGKGCALELIRSGAKVVLNDRPGSPDLDATQKEIEELSGECLTVEADVFDYDSTRQLVESAIGWQGGIDILVSNPAVSLRDDFLKFKIQDFERVIHGTLISGFNLAQQVAQHMVERNQGGKIIFISSVQGEMPMARCIAYGVAKAGVNQMGCTMAVELAKYGINVNVIAPGWIDTPGERVFYSEEMIRMEGARLPFGRLGTPADIGQTAAFLASDNADYITGMVLRVDGGFVHKHCRAD